MAGKRWGFPELGQRIRQRIAALGYTWPDGTPNIPAFLTAHPHYLRTSFYKWCDEVEPTFPATWLETLARDLQVTKGWLCFGDEGAPSWRQTVASLLVALTVLWPGDAASDRVSNRPATLPVVTFASYTRRHPPYQKLRAILSWLTEWWRTPTRRLAWA